ncbi:DUF5694 domain-containing protein [Pullulanibacillus pueri]|uniref:Uncharacterized protein n=1 Tax=Pullulanibacillus pueri TaxID=1437324 RepID=A0A8J2ZTQ8_9BACL|nr:DUF5694 domain-containing protein [Pullulanibacillus pueri]GGH76789.1 hypothetical protein GCM10007096_07720 [Pullulanibacillus pueri]
MRPTNDLNQMKTDDLLSERRQTEIGEVVEKIKAFRPTKVAVELVTKKDEELNIHYQKYLNDEYSLQVSEIDQIGFRIAQAFGHKKLYAIDWLETEDIKKGLGDIYEWAQENQPDLFDYIFNRILAKQIIPELNETTSILSIYKRLNSPESLKDHHKVNVNIARLGTIDNYVGLDWLTWWYKRNLILYSNLTRLATSSKERVLFIVGGSHVEIINRFILESEFAKVEYAYDYLK